MEIEAIYLLGDFSVKTNGKWEQLDKNATRYTGGFEIDSPIRQITLKNIEKQGFSFFFGEMNVEGDVDISGENPVLDISRKGINVVKVKIGEKEKVILTDERISLSDFDVTGKVKIKLSLINNLRNILGPHHLDSGESYTVCPSSFFKEPCVWTMNPEKWNDGYCFVEMGL